MPRSAIMITRSLKLSLKLVYQLTHKMMICPSKCRPLKSASTGPKGCILPSSAIGSVCTRAGETFRASNQGVGAGFAPDPYPEFGQCVHKIARHEAAPGRLYMQNHGGWADWTGPGGPRPDIGVLRSDDYGQTWRSIAKGLPSDFGFPIVVHPHDAHKVYVV